MFKLMIADDNPYALGELRDMVDWEEFDLNLVATFRNGRELLNAAQNDLPDVVITDISMPILNGVALAAALQALSPHVKIVFLSNHSDFEYMQQALHLHVFGYLLKPFDPVQLAAVMRNVVQELCNERLQRFESTQYLQKAESYRVRAVEHYMHKLLLQTEDTQLIRYKLQELDYALCESFFLRVAHVLLPSPLNNNDNERANIFRSILQTHPKNGYDLILLEHSNTALSILIIYCAPNFDVDNLLSQLHIDIETATGISPNIGFSAAAQEFSMMAQLRKQAIIAATQQQSTLTPVISYGDISTDNTKPTKKHSPATISSYVSKMREYIHANYRLPITTNDVASAVFLSASYANQCFSAECHCTIFDYITQCRIEQAKQLLAKTDTKVASIAELVGYNGKTSFYLAFKRNVGVSPTEYRTMHRSSVGK